MSSLRFDLRGTTPVVATEMRVFDVYGRQLADGENEHEVEEQLEGGNPTRLAIAIAHAGMHDTEFDQPDEPAGHGGGGGAGRPGPRPAGSATSPLISGRV
ncbi:hypothetical protein ACIQ7Q_11740 [Streptomyces sp. NPDC096176]|uniref:hypothetical protein n=1 Tax=Streptomyces sp. NPDC096176 TaxID=3366079 RepID=UPI0038087F2A